MDSSQTFGFWSCIFIALLIFASGCSTPAQMQHPNSSETEPKPTEFFSQDSLGDEGMWLLPKISGPVYAELKAKGLKLPAAKIYHPDSASLNRAIVRINEEQEQSGTGSFVSEKGLILTNYTILQDAITKADLNQQNYLEKGFYADSNGNEIPLQNISLHIAIEQQEVTGQISSQLPDTLAYYERQRESQKIREQLIAKRKNGDENLLVEINDFWGGNRQLMSVYKVIRDVRLVHVPPASVVGFGDNTEDSVWPQHSGNFAFLRAYVGPEGSSRSYDKSNTIFKPARHLSIDTAGVAPDNFTMSLGFPGETYRHKSSYASAFHYEHRNPVLIKSYQAIVDAQKYLDDQNTANEQANPQGSIVNNLQYYRDIQKGFDKYNILEQKRTIEKKFSQWVRQDSLRNIKYRRVLDQLDQAYSIASQSGDLLYAMVYPLNNNKLLQIAGLYDSYRQFLDDSTNSNINQSDKDSLLKNHRQILDNTSKEAQNIMLAEMLHTLATLPDGKVMFHLLDLFEAEEGDSLKAEIQTYLEEQQQKSIIYNPEKAKELLSLSIEDARAEPMDELVKLYREMLETYRFSRKNYIQHTAYSRPAQERFVEGMLELRADSTEYADANSTLRLSSGRVQGFHSSQDSLYQSPISTLESKRSNTSELPQDSKVQTANFLTTNDISDGSQGSPILNEEGDLMGLTFDQNSAGVASDYLYNPEARAINVDIRYILYSLREFAGTEDLLLEMNVGK